MGTTLGKLGPFLVSTLFAVLIDCGGRVPAGDAVKVRLCDVIDSPSKFVGRRMTFRGQFWSDCKHGSVLTDFSCRYRGIATRADDRLTKSKQDALYDTVCPQNPQDWYRFAVAASFTGVVRHNDTKGSLLLFQPEFELVITDLDEAKVVKNPT